MGYLSIDLSTTLKYSKFLDIQIILFEMNSDTVIKEAVSY